MNLPRLLQQALGGELRTDDLDLLTELAYKHLQVRVGTELAARLTDEQVLDFEAAQQSGGDAAAAWLNHHCPDHAHVVIRCTDMLLDEIRTQVRRADVRFWRDRARPV